VFVVIIVTLLPWQNYGQTVTAAVMERALALGPLHSPGGSTLQWDAGRALMRLF